MAQVTISTDGLIHKVVSLYVTDPQWRACRVSIDINDKAIHIDGIHGDRFVVFACVEVAGFGRTRLRLDGQDEGLTPGQFNMAVELLRSRMKRCNQLAQSAEAHEWDAIDDQANDAVASADPTACSNLLSQAIIVSEELLYHQCQNLTTHHADAPIISATLFGERQGEYSIGVGPDWPANDAPDFTRDVRSLELALNLIGGTTLPNLWRYIEFTRGNYRWERIDNIIEIAQQRGLAIKSFALYWGHIGGCPPWFRTLSYSEQLSAIETWVKAIVLRYKGIISCWETVNEMHDWCFANPCSWNHDQLLHVTKMVNELVGTLDPGTPRLINNCCIWGDYLQSPPSTPAADAQWQPTWTPLSYLDDVCATGIAFEAIGLQYYNPGRDILACYDTLAKYAEFGKQLQITEMGTPSLPPTITAVETQQVDLMAGWRGTWTPAIQALWMDRFFTIMAEPPQLTALNYWDFDDAQAFIPSAGLLDNHFNPKPSHHRLSEIANAWRNKPQRRP